MTRKTKETALAFTLICSVALFIYSIDIYRETMIPWKNLILPWIIGGVLFTGLLYRTFYTPTYKKGGTIFFCVVCGVGITNFMFLKMNQAFADKTIATGRFAIEKQGKIGRREQPYVHINFNGLEKDLVFKTGNVDPGEKYTEVALEYSKGLFGYQVVHKKVVQ